MLNNVPPLPIDFQSDSQTALESRLVTTSKPVLAVPPGLSNQLTRPTMRHLMVGVINDRPTRRTRVSELEDAALRDDIRERGIQTPIEVRVTGPDQFELVTGQRRLDAAKSCAITTIPAWVFNDMTEAEAISRWVREEVQTVPLDPRERTWAVLNGLELQLDMDRQTLFSWLNYCANVRRGVTKPRATWSVPGSESGGRNVAELTKLMNDFMAPLMKISTLMRNGLPMLQLSDELSELIQSGQISISVATTIGTVQSEVVRQSLIELAKRERLTVNAVRQLIRPEGDQKPETETAPKPTSVQRHFVEIAPTLDSILAGDHGIIHLQKLWTLLSGALEIVRAVERKNAKPPKQSTDQEPADAE